jgi:hypothetical protein
MFEVGKTVHIRELCWLAHCCEMQGHENKARRILATNAQHRHGSTDPGNDKVVNFLGDEI